MLEVLKDSDSIKTNEKTLNERLLAIREENKLKQEKIEKLIEELSKNEKELLVTKKDSEVFRVVNKIFLKIFSYKNPI